MLSHLNAHLVYRLFLINIFLESQVLRDVPVQLIIYLGLHNCANYKIEKVLTVKKKKKK